MVGWIALVAAAVLQTAPVSSEAKVGEKSAPAALDVSQAQPADSNRRRTLQPLTSPGTWVTGNDYPVEAIKAHQTGVVGFRLRIDAQGVPISCAITAPASPVLDAETCRLMMARARFKPALDENSQPVAANFSSHFSWELPGLDLPAMTAWAQTSRLVIGSAGKMLSCETKLQGTVRAIAFCDLVRAKGVPLTFTRMADAATDQKPLLLLIELGMNFDGQPAVAPSYLSSPLQRRSLVRVTFDTTDKGGIGNCSQVENSGDAAVPMQLCDIMAATFVDNKLGTPIPPRGDGWATILTGRP